MLNDPKALLDQVAKGFPVATKLQEKRVLSVGQAYWKLDGRSHLFLSSAVVTIPKKLF